MELTQKIRPFLWFDDQAEAAARFYVGIFDNARIGTITRYSSAGHEIHGRAPGSVMTVEFELAGQPFTALNGGPHFRFSEAISFEIVCESQAKIDRYWDRLLQGDGAKPQQCGWLKDRYGLSWQVVPRILRELFADAESASAQRAMHAMLKMTRLDIAELQRAHDG